MEGPIFCSQLANCLKRGWSKAVKQNVLSKLVSFRNTPLVSSRNIPLVSSLNSPLLTSRNSPRLINSTQPLLAQEFVCPENNRIPSAHLQKKQLKIDLSPIEVGNVFKVKVLKQKMQKIHLSYLCLLFVKTRQGHRRGLLLLSRYKKVKSTTFVGKETFYFFFNCRKVLARPSPILLNGRLKLCDRPIWT